MKDKSKLIAIILVIITLIVVIVSNLTKNNESEKEKISIVTNYSNFYTVNSCLYRLTTYLSLDDSKNVILLLNEQYKKNNRITTDNVMDLFIDVEGDSTFISQKMYYSNINSNITKYYVKGYIEKNQLFDDEVINNLNKTDVYFIVYLDSSNKTFSIEPYDGEIFIKGVEYEK